MSFFPIAVIVQYPLFWCSDKLLLIGEAILGTSSCFWALGDKDKGNPSVKQQGGCSHKDH